MSIGGELSKDAVGAEDVVVRLNPRAGVEKRSSVPRSVCFCIHRALTGDRQWFWPAGPRRGSWQVGGCREGNKFSFLKYI